MRPSPLIEPRASWNTFNCSNPLHELYPTLKKLRHHRLALFAYPLSGGFEHPSLMPTWMVRSFLALESFFDVLSRYLAFRIIVVLEKESF